MIIFLSIFFGFFFAIVGIEFLYGKVKGKSMFRFHDTLASINIAFLNQVIEFFSKGIVVAGYAVIFNKFALFDIPNNFFTFLLCLVFFDFCFYWAHRSSHNINFLWGAHIVHHQSDEFNTTITFRTSWLLNVYGMLFFFPVPLLGFSPALIGAAFAVTTYYPIWVHTKAIGKTHPIIEFLFNTPSNHRVHHGCNEKYMNKNYGNFLIIWDRMFGTYQVEEEEPEYGLDTRFKSLNPLWAFVHYYVEIFRGMFKAKNWKDKFKILWAEPGWLPEGVESHEEMAGPVHQVQNNFETPKNDNFNYYILFQFVFYFAGLLVFLFFFEKLALSFQLIFLAAIVLTTVSVTSLSESRRWNKWLEFGRLLAIPLVVVYPAYLVLSANWVLPFFVIVAIYLTVSLLWFVALNRNNQAIEYSG